MRKTSLTNSQICKLKCPERTTWNHDWCILQAHTSTLDKDSFRTQHATFMGDVWCILLCVIYGEDTDLTYTFTHWIVENLCYDTMSRSIFSKFMQYDRVWRYDPTKGSLTHSHLTPVSTKFKIRQFKHQFPPSPKVTSHEPSKQLRISTPKSGSSHGCWPSDRHHAWTRTYMLQQPRQPVVPQGGQGKCYLLQEQSA